MSVSSRTSAFAVSLAFGFFAVLGCSPGNTAFDSTDLDSFSNSRTVFDSVATTETEVVALSPSTVLGSSQSALYPKGVTLRLPGGGSNNTRIILTLDFSIQDRSIFKTCPVKDESALQLILFCNGSPTDNIDPFDCLKRSLNTDISLTQVYTGDKLGGYLQVAKNGFNILGYGTLRLKSSVDIDSLRNYNSGTYFNDYQNFKLEVQLKGFLIDSIFQDPAVSPPAAGQIQSYQAVHFGGETMKQELKKRGFPQTCIDQTW